MASEIIRRRYCAILRRLQLSLLRINKKIITTITVIHLLLVVQKSSSTSFLTELSSSGRMSLQRAGRLYLNSKKRRICFQPFIPPIESRYICSISKTAFCYADSTKRTQRQRQRDTQQNDDLNGQQKLQSSTRFASSFTKFSLFVQNRNHILRKNNYNNIFNNNVIQLRSSSSNRNENENDKNDKNGKVIANDKEEPVGAESKSDTDYFHVWDDYDDTIYRERTIRWLKDIVIGMNLCPFADKPYRNGLVRVDVIPGKDEHDILSAVLAACWIREVSHGTTLVVCPDLFPDDFLQFWDVAQLIEQGLFQDYKELQGSVQVVPFHPLFRFENNDNINNIEEIPSDWTNRSPYPMFHILREDEVSDAVDKINGDASRVWLRNVNLMNELYEKLTKPVFENYMKCIMTTNSTPNTTSDVGASDTTTPTSTTTTDEQPPQLTDEQLLIIQQTLRKYRIQMNTTTSPSNEMDE